MANERRGAVFAGIALVGVLVAAYAGYGLLSSRVTEAEAALVDDQSDAAPASNDVSKDRVMLADYDATVYDESGLAPSTLSSLAGGKPLVINFWATWCPYCVQELPDLQGIYRDFADRVSFAFIDVADGTREKVETAAAWLDEHGYEDLPAYYDTDLSASSAFGAWSLPTTVVVASDGEIMTISPGVIDPELLRGALTTLTQ